MQNQRRIYNGSDKKTSEAEQVVTINVGNVTLQGNLVVPQKAQGVVLFAHGSGSSRFSPRNRYVAGVLQEAHIATLLLDLLSLEEGVVDEVIGKYRFNIDLLAARLLAATDYIRQESLLKDLAIGYFGASTGAAAALVAAAQRPESIKAIVSRGGRPDLAGEALEQITAPTLLIVGGVDYEVIKLNKQALDQLIHTKKKELSVVSNATHLFEEPGALEEVAKRATDWFKKYL